MTDELNLPITELYDILNEFKTNFNSTLLASKQFQADMEDYLLENEDSTILKEKIKERINEVLDDEF